jgi:threonine dehydratase
MRPANSKISPSSNEANVVLNLPTLDDVERAAARLSGVALRTPVLTSRTLDDACGATVFAKAENFQRAGAFKFRGAYNAVASMSSEARRRGVATYSSGNHAQAVALAAALHDVPAVILMPEDAPASKVAATRGYGAEVVFYDRYGEERDSVGDALGVDRAMTRVPPFNHWDVIAGQGTAALELLEDCGELDLLLVCVGGGGLISGCATVAAAQARPPRVVGVEPEAGDDVRQSLESGQIVTIATPRTIADGQQTTAPGDKTFAVIEQHVDAIVTVSDAEIVESMRFAFERMKIVLEPSGASALAALRSGKLDVAGARVGVTLSGGNIDAARFAALVGPVI